MPNRQETVAFAVTADHIALLRRMSVRTAVTVSGPEDSGSWGLFTCRPDVGKKRPFGNSGEPACSVLEELGMTGDDGTYGQEDYEYARLLLIELPLAYEAVMAHGAVDPCTVELDRHAAWFEYRSRRALEYWRDALAEAAALPSVDPERLVEFAMNARNGTPADWVDDFRRMAICPGWIRDAYDVIARHALAKWRAAWPELAGRPDGDAFDMLLSGDRPLSWPGPASRPGTGGGA